MSEVTERAKSMILAIDAAAVHGIGGAHPDSSVRKMLSDLLAEVARLTPRRIETTDEWEAVEPGTVLKTTESVVCRFWDREHGVVFGDERPFKWSCVTTELPAVVLWSPGGAS